jgi:hypothetical protein
MATILPFVKDGVFDHEDITAMSMALDDVCKTLNLRDDNSAREVIATRIIDLAKAGERNPMRLRDRILHEADLARHIGLDEGRQAYYSKGIDRENWGQSWTRLHNITNTRTNAEVWPQRQKTPSTKSSY